MVDTGPRDGAPSPSKGNPPPPSGKDTNLKKDKRPDLDNEKSPGKPKQLLPLCPFSTCAEKSERHYIRNCPHATDKQNEEVPKKIAKERKSTGPATNTRQPKDKKKSEVPKTVGLVSNSSHKCHTSP